MNRTIKFQLSNLKQTYLYGALITYGAMAIFGVLYKLVDTGTITRMSMQPTWLVVVTLLLTPFTFLAVLYALFDGLMYFDTALRFGISRQSYFVTQLVIYIFLTLMLAVANGLTEVAYTGTTATYFTQITENYLSFGHLASEFIQTLGLGVVMLAFYRFKVKALIPLIFAGPAIAIIAAASYGMTGDSAVMQLIVKLAEFVFTNPELSAMIVIVVLVGIYYLLVTKTEVQD